MMRKSLVAVVLGLAGVSGGCQHSNAEAPAWRRIAADGQTGLAVLVEGGPKGHLVSDSAAPAKEGETIHRVLRGEDGGVLFSYDVVMKKTSDKKQYKLLLTPVKGGGPTFASKREVLARADEDLVRVELMEQPETHEKIVDVYRLMAGQEVKDLHSMSLMEMHNAVFRWVHGQMRGK